MLQTRGDGLCGCVVPTIQQTPETAKCPQLLGHPLHIQLRAAHEAAVDPAREREKLSIDIEI